MKPFPHEIGDSVDRGKRQSRFYALLGTIL